MHNKLQLEQILNKVDSIILLLSRQYNILWMNEKAQRILNWKNEETIGKSFAHLCKKHEISCPILQDFSHKTETELYTNDKTEIVRWEFKDISDPDDNQLLLIGEFVTELKTLRKQNYELSTIIKKVPGFVFWKDTNCVLRGCNENFAYQVGLKKPEDIVGKSDYDLPWKPEETERFLRDDKEIMRTGKEKINIEEPQTQKDGKQALLLTSKTPIRNEQNKIIGILGIYVDITDRKRAEEYRIKAERAKHEAAQKVLNFSNLVAGSIAHELKNPLTGIRIHMEALQNLDVSKMSPQVIKTILKDITASIIKTVDSTTYVINGMLKKVRTFATGEVHHKEFQELSIVNDVENLLITYPFKNDEQRDLVKVCYEARFNYSGDSVLTAHVLSNLMKNALHAVEQTSKKKVGITITTKSGADFNLLIFRDTATGISKDFLSKIFDQFETKKDVHGGTGLGLAFCKSVMEDSYKGSITCNSEKGKYTEFVLSFPKLKPHEILLSTLPDMKLKAKQKKDKK